MKRIFIQAHCRYPHGEALANYTYNLIKAVLNAGYEVILITSIDDQGELLFVDDWQKGVTIVPIIPSINKAIQSVQKEEGFCEERLQVLKMYHINADDRVIIIGIWNEYFLIQLFELESKVRFKTLCCVLELFGPEDYKSKEQYELMMHIKGEIYLMADAIISISDYITEYYINRRKLVYKFPPMIDSDEYSIRRKRMGKCCFIIPSGKDSLNAVLSAFANLEDEVLTGIELHLCGLTTDCIQETKSLPEWSRLEMCVVIHGWMKYEELIGLYKDMHFLLIARKRCQRTLANFPSKVPETMNYGIVPIVADVGDYTKYYLEENYDSIFMKDDSVQEVEKAIRRAIAMNIDEYMSYSNNAKRTAEVSFDYRAWKLQIQKMIRLE